MAESGFPCISISQLTRLQWMAAALLTRRWVMLIQLWRCLMFLASATQIETCLWITLCILITQVCSLKLEIIILLFTVLRCWISWFAFEICLFCMFSEEPLLFTNSTEFDPITLPPGPALEDHVWILTVKIRDRYWSTTTEDVRVKIGELKQV